MTEPVDEHEWLKRYFKGPVPAGLSVVHDGEKFAVLQHDARVKRRVDKPGYRPMVVLEHYVRLFSVDKRLDVDTDKYEQEWVGRSSDPMLSKAVEALVQYVEEQTKRGEPS